MEAKKKKKLTAVFITLILSVTIFGFVLTEDVSPEIPPEVGLNLSAKEIVALDTEIYVLVFGESDTITFVSPQTQGGWVSETFELPQRADIFYPEKVAPEIWEIVNTFLTSPGYMVVVSPGGDTLYYYQEGEMDLANCMFREGKTCSTHALRRFLAEALE